MRRGRLDTKRQFLNKWEMYHALRFDPVADLHLPKTRLLTFSSLRTMLARWQHVYIKPVETWGGSQISKISKAKKGWIVYTQNSPPNSFLDIEKLGGFILNMYENQKTIIQRMAPVAMFEHRPLDIRILMQRNNLEKWLFSGMLARIGGKHSIVSNIEISHGQVLPVSHVLQKILVPNTLYQRQQTIKKLKKTAKNICTVLDTYTCFNEVGIDYGIQKNGRLWLFEVNTNDTLGSPSHELFAKLPDQRIYRKIEQRTAVRNTFLIKQLLSPLFEANPTPEADS